MSGAGTSSPYTSWTYTSLTLEFLVSPCVSAGGVVQCDLLQNPKPEDLYRRRFSCSPAWDLSSRLKEVFPQDPATAHVGERSLMLSQVDLTHFNTMELAGTCHMRSGSRGFAMSPQDG